MIPPPVLEQINELSGQLGYVPVDEKWGTAAVPADLRATAASPQARPRPWGGPPGWTALAAERLTYSLTHLDGQFADRWGACAEESFMVVALPPAADGATGPARWRVDLAARTLTALPGPAQDTDEDDGTSWDIVGSADVWDAVVTGRTNLGVALRRCELRYCEEGESGPVIADTRIALLSELLSLSYARAGTGGAPP
jgi:hypothetical protein